VIVVTRVTSAFPSLDSVEQMFYSWCLLILREVTADEARTRDPSVSAMRSAGAHDREAAVLFA
jgi:hypothetical protein